MQSHLAYEDVSVKARSAAPHEVEQRLEELNARFAGEDAQSDTYYQVPVGKLKLREGNIENLLTHYLREEENGKMKTTVFVYEKNPSHEVRQRYTGSLKVIGKVTKRRRIYFIDNVKFHVDRFENGTAFVEIEAIDRDGTLGPGTIRMQAENYKRLLSIQKEDIITESYIDML